MSCQAASAGRPCTAHTGHAAPARPSSVSRPPEHADTGCGAKLLQLPQLARLQGNRSHALSVPSRIVRACRAQIISRSRDVSTKSRIMSGTSRRSVRQLKLRQLSRSSRSALPPGTRPTSGTVTPARPSVKPAGRHRRNRGRCRPARRPNCRSGPPATELAQESFGDTMRLDRLHAPGVFLVQCLRMPSRVSEHRFRPLLRGHHDSSTSTTRKLLVVVLEASPCS